MISPVGRALGVAFALLLAGPLRAAPLASTLGGSNGLVGDPAVLVDGRVLPEGTIWKARGAVIFKRDGWVLLDLQQSVAIGAVMIQGDDNDSYHIAGSMDGNEWTPLADAGPSTEGAGLRQRRTVVETPATARFVKVTASGGDGNYALTEVCLFTKPPEKWEDAVAVDTGSIYPTHRDDPWIWLEPLVALAVPLILLLGVRRFLVTEITPDRPTVTFLIVVAVALGIYGIWKRDYPNYFEWHRYMVQGGLIALVLAFTAFLPANLGGRLGLERKLVLAVLLAVSVPFYYNFGRFHGPNYVHYYEFAHYYTGSKYFPELGYHGLYPAFLAADRESNKIFLPTDDVRDLDSNELVKVQDLEEAATRARAAFTPERWESFLEDHRYFVDRVSEGRWKGLVTDHGYNPSPIWTVTGHALTSLMAKVGKDTGDSVAILSRLDPFLLVVMFLTLAWAFGPLAGCLAALWWALTAIVPYDYTGGAFLRQDWFFATMTGLALHARGRPWLAGALLAYAAGTRVFPGVFLIAPVWQIARDLWHGRPVDPVSRGTVASFSITGLFLVGLSLATVADLGSWEDFIANARSHDSGAYTNHVSFRNAVHYHPRSVGKTFDFKWDLWRKEKEARFRAWKPVFYLVVGAIFAFYLGLATRMPVREAMYMAGFLPFLFFYPANYYDNFLMPALLFAMLRGVHEVRDCFVILLAALAGRLLITDYDEFTLYQSACVAVWMFWAVRWARPVRARSDPLPVPLPSSPAPAAPVSPPVTSVTPPTHPDPTPETRKKKKRR